MGQLRSQQLVPEGVGEMSPTRIAARYELQDQLGEGGMGVVWRALDTKTGSYVAIKIMKDISDPVAVELFTKEWRALAEMCHPNIVDVRDVDVIEENRQRKPFFVMPLLQGATLSELIADASARLTVARIVEIMSQVCKGLQAAHQRGLVHRDLKPSNIFVMDDDTAKIIDFGVVHLAGSKSVTGQKGTFQYMSPEQAQLREITPASDIFSLGVILYEALTLRKPFGRNTADETMQAVIKYIPPPVSEINPSINQSISKVVHKCLAKQPVHRFASARDLAETLQKAFRNEIIFDPAKIQPRIERARTAFKAGDEAFASEILAEIEAEGNLDPQISVLRTQIELAAKQKKVRHLLESARARMEQDEVPLALDKVREVLELDPENAEALAMRESMEKQRSETQIAKWLDLGKTHLDNRDFGAARHAVQEVLTIRSGDTRALDLLEKIESTEAEAKRVREQKEQLYTSALRAYQNGAIDTALERMERLFSVARANPSAAVPERDAVFQSFYKEVRSEHDGLHTALEEAHRQFSEKDFAGALMICQELLAKYPNDGTFQALKIQIEDAERQELSAYIAEISKRTESEPDLDRRANILREASERYPKEAQFAQQLKLVRERRDLVNSIVAKARQYEERRQYSEAISQWDILRNIHPQYPGIAIELEQCKKKRDRQAREEEHSRLVEEIDALLEGRAYTRAIECAKTALQEYPGDAELAGLLTLAEQGVDRVKESRRLFEAGQQALAEKDLAKATELLRNSLQLDPRGPGLRDAVVNVLAERARTLAEDNWREAEPLYQEANDLDPQHPLVRSLRSTVMEARRQTYVGQCLAEARAMVAAGNSQAAAEKVRTARTEYPNDPRLEQYEVGLLKEVNELRRKEERGKDRVALGEVRRALDQDPAPARVREVLEMSHAIRARHPDDPEIEQTVAEIELAVRRVAKVDDLSQLLQVETAFTGTNGRSAAAPVQKAPPSPKKGPKLVEQTKIYKEPTAPKAPKKPARDHFVPVKAAFVKAQQSVVEFFRPAGVWSPVRMGAVGAAIVLVAVGVYFGTSHRSRPVVEDQSTTTTEQQMQVVTEPQDSIVTVDGKAVTNGMVALGSNGEATVQVAKLGYKTKQVQVRQGGDNKIVLEPEPVRLSVATSEKSGSVELDGQKISDVADGPIDDFEVPADGNSHTLSVVAQGKRLFTMGFQAIPGSRPNMTSLDANDVVVIAGLGNDARFYGGGQVKSVQVGDKKVPISSSGVDLSFTDQDREVRFGEGNDQGSLSIQSSNAPVLAVQSINADGQVRITTNVESAVLTVDGQPVKRHRKAWQVVRTPGRHAFVLSAEGYEPQSWTMNMQRRQTVTREVALTPKSKKATLAPLIITGSTPGALVEVDGKRVAELDGSGNGTISDLLSSGQHTLVLQKPPLFEPVTLPLTANAPAEVRVVDVKLTARATLAFQTNVGDVSLKLRKVGETQFRDVKASSKFAVTPGQYEIVAEAPGFQKYTAEIKLSPGQNVTVPLGLIAIPSYVFQDETQITQADQWFKSKTRDRFVYLRPGFLHQNLVFVRPSPGVFTKKKVQWVVETADGSARVLYELDSPRLGRRLMVGETSADHKEANVSALSVTNPSLLSVHVWVDGNHIRVTGDKGDVFDDYVVPGHDFLRGRIGIKTEAQFIVRSNN